MKSGLPRLVLSFRFLPLRATCTDLNVDRIRTCTYFTGVEAPGRDRTRCERPTGTSSGGRESMVLQSRTGPLGKVVLQRL